MSVQPPKPPDGTRQSLSERRIFFCGPLKSGAQVVMIVFEFSEPVGGLSGLQLRLSLFAKKAEVLRVQSIYFLLITTLLQRFEGKLTNDFEHLKARIISTLISRRKKVVFYQRGYTVSNGKSPS